MSGREDGVPVTIRGVQYRSMAAAGRALGVSTVAVWKAKHGGWLDTVGIARRARKTRRQPAPDVKEPWSPVLPWETDA